MYIHIFIPSLAGEIILLQASVRNQTSLLVFQMVTDTSCVRQKPHRRANRQMWVQPSTSTKATARLWCQDCCVGNSHSGRWALTSSPTWTDGSVRKRSTRSCGMRPSTTWLDAPSYTTLSTWQTRSAKSSMVRFESVSGSLLNHDKN